MHLDKKCLQLACCTTFYFRYFFFRAAFQYGVKMSDGRKTRRAGPKDEKSVLDRQWQQIQNIMNKRKAMAESGGGDEKKAKY